MTRAATNGKPVRLMLYSDDSFGLGHLKRNTAIATCFVRALPGASALLVVGCPVGAFFQLPAGVDFLKIPSIIKVDTGVYQPRALRISLERTRALRAFTIRKATEVFAPHLFLVDHMPTGIWAELLPTLKMLKRRRTRPQIILGLRDILDRPEVTRELWRRGGAYDAIGSYYDMVLIYGCQEVFDTASQYGLDDALSRKVEYCGYVCSEEPYKAREEIREELRIQKDKLVVVTAGGGYDAYPMMQACVETFRLLGDGFPLEALLITGPLMGHEGRESLRKQAEGLRVRVLKSVEDNVSYMNAADLVVTMAGYNTLVEAVRLMKRIVVIPREGPSAEQRMRAQLFSRLGLIQTISPEQLAPSVLAQAILTNLVAGPAPPTSLSTGGLKKVVDALMWRLGPVHRS